jgi:hypothetical protein
VLISLILIWFKNCSLFLNLFKSLSFQLLLHKKSNWLKWLKHKLSLMILAAQLFNIVFVSRKWKKSFFTGYETSLISQIEYS